MADELRSVNSAVSDETLIVRILQTVPPSYRSLLSAWDSVPREDQTIANLTGRLVTEELWAKTHGVVDPADVAFFATRPNRIHLLQHQHSEANAAQSSGWRMNNYRNNQPNNRGNHRGGQSNQRGRQRGKRKGWKRLLELWNDEPQGLQLQEQEGWREKRS
jgi:gag-polypeptide of LTR copia-type